MLVAAAVTLPALATLGTAASAEDVATLEEQEAMLPHIEIPDAEGKETVIRVCTECHKVNNFATLRQDEAEWQALLEKMMMEKDAFFTLEEEEVIMAYLTTQFAPGVPVPEAHIAAVEAGKIMEAEKKAAEAAGEPGA